jgi:hypothetical protein
VERRPGAGGLHPRRALLCAALCAGSVTTGVVRRSPVGHFVLGRLMLRREAGPRAARCQAADRRSTVCPGAAGARRVCRRVATGWPRGRPAPVGPP